MIDLPHKQFDSPQSGPHLLVTAGVHGDEYEPMEAVRVLINQLPARLRHGRVTLIPVVNESAFRLARRTGEDGLDLARTCPGRADGSSTERVAHRLSQFIRQADYYIDLHTGGSRLNVHPMVGYVLHPEEAVLAKQRELAHAFGLPILWGTTPTLEGRSLSVARDANVPALYAEYHGNPYDPNAVGAYVDGCLRVLHALGMIETAPARSPNEPLIVEDDRPNSGHMQICHPAPWEGLFLPLAILGQRITKGEILGTITDTLGDRVETVTADRSGIVLVLHSSPRIAKDDSVAVILETT